MNPSDTIDQKQILELDRSILDDGRTAGAAIQPHEESLTLAKLKDLYERVQRECPPPERYELRVHSMMDLQRALNATRPDTSISALETAGVKVFVVDIIPPWKAILLNVSEVERADDEWQNRRITTEEWLRRRDACMSIIDLADAGSVVPR